MKDIFFSQEIKADAGKPRVSLVPKELIYAIARVREHGIKKYGDKETWREVETQRYIDALYRHVLEFVEDPTAIDEESGLPTLFHVACNVAFLLYKLYPGKKSYEIPLKKHDTPC